MASYCTSPKRGLPIGNLTSQHFANFYLLPLDRWIKETLRRRGYVRYMDDFLIFGQSRKDLGACAKLVEEFVSDRLSLALKTQQGICRIDLGFVFLGYRVCSDMPNSENQHGPRMRVSLSRRSRLRFRRKLRDLASKWEAGTVSDLDFQRRSLALAEFTHGAAAANFRRGVIGGMECEAIGHEPCDSRRQLEQRAPQLPVLEPQRQPAGQPEQQPWFPGCSGPSSAGDPDGCPPADPASTPAEQLRLFRACAPRPVRW